MPKSVTTIKPAHLGEILLEGDLVSLGLSANKFAKHINVLANRVALIINDSRGLSGDTALRFAKAFDMTIELWMNIKAQYDLETAEDEGCGSHDCIAKLAAAFQLYEIPEVADSILALQPWDHIRRIPR